MEDSSHQNPAALSIVIQQHDSESDGAAAAADTATATTTTTTTTAAAAAEPTPQSEHINDNALSAVEMQEIAENERRPSVSKHQPSMMSSFVQSVMGVLESDHNQSILDIDDWDDERLEQFVDSFDDKAHLVLMAKKMAEEGFMLPSIDISFRNLLYTRDGQILVNGVSGYLHRGSMTAVMGPNSTPFLEALADRLPKSANFLGEILVNGQPPRRHYGRLVGYVPKDDVHLPNLTVRETLRFSSHLRGSPDVPVRVRDLLVEVLMKMLGLRHVADTVVGDGAIRGVSGGEKRRVSLGVEIAAGHSIMVCDLVTNGLDSATALDIVRKMRIISQAERSFVLSIVQASPELFAEFDNIMCLSRGATVYFGPPSRAIEFFTEAGFERPPNKSVPDFITELLSFPEKYYNAPLVRRVDPAKLQQTDLKQQHLTIESASGAGEWVAQSPPTKITRKLTVEADSEDSKAVTFRNAWSSLQHSWHASADYAELGKELWHKFQPNFDLRVEEAPRKINAHFGEQLKEVMKRELTLTLRNMPVTVGGIMRSILFGLVVGTVFFDLGVSQVDVRAGIGLLFFVLLNQSTIHMQIVPMLCERRAVYYEQRDAGFFLHWAYYISYTLVGLPFLFLETFIFVILAYGLADLRGGVGGSEFWFALLIVYVTSITARSLIFFIATAAPNVEAAQGITPAVVIVSMLWSGFLIPRDSIPLAWRWLYYCSFLSYPMRALALNEYQGVSGYTGAGFQTGDELLEFYNMDSTDSSLKWSLFGALIGFFLFFNVLALYAIAFIDWKGETFVVEESGDEVSTLHRQLSARTITRASEQQPSKIRARNTVLEFSNLSYSVPVPNPASEHDSNAPKKIDRKLLNNVNGYAVPGRMIALMGASGAGKSTLLDVLAGKKTGGKLGGDILVNGVPKDDKSFGRFTGYVEQFDSHVPSTTVREALTFSARLRLPSDMSVHAQDKLVQAVLEELDLVSYADVQIGSPATGGLDPEIRKKVTIAVELVMQPSLLFLDEPTTGLNSAAAMDVMEATRRLAEQIPVICTIHQPSQEVISLFDWILLLQPGGTMVYFGPLEDLPAYLEEHGYGKYTPGTNIADFALDVLRERSVQMAAENRKHASVEPSPSKDAAMAIDEPIQVRAECIDEKTSSVGSDASLEPNAQWEASKQCSAIIQALKDGVAPDNQPPPQFEHEYAASWFTMFWLLAQRFLQQDIRERITLIVRVGLVLGVGFIVGTLYWQLGDTSAIDAQNRVSLAFFVVLFLFFSPGIIVAKYVNFRPIYFREHTNRVYSPSAFYIARFVADFPIVLICSFVFSICIFWIPNFAPTHQGPYFGAFFSMILMTNLTAYAFAEFTSIVAPDAELATVLQAVPLTFWMLLAGFLTSFSRIPDAWKFLYYFNFVRYPLNFMAALGLEGFDAGRATLDVFDIDKNDRGFFFLMTFVFYVALRVINYLALRFISYIKR
jgi:ATP-binding cassette, subfamily G (WHITE), member 2, PDR